MDNYDAFYDKLEEGLDLLGWHLSIRFTNEDNAQLKPIAERAIELNKNNRLSPEERDELSLKAYNILSFQVIGIDRRADAISTIYVHCPYLSSLITLVDEASFAFYRGYFTSSLTILIIVLERYLRAVYVNDTGQSPSLRELINHVPSFPDSESANLAHKIVNILYYYYNVESPPSYEFNRHGLMHGLRGMSQYDEMNCARIYQLFDILCRAQEIERTCYGDYLNWYKIRYSIYKGCLTNNAEQRLLSL